MEIKVHWGRVCSIFSRRACCHTLSNFWLTSKKKAELYCCSSNALFIISARRWHCCIVECAFRKPNWCRGIHAWKCVSLYILLSRIFSKILDITGKRQIGLYEVTCKNCLFIPKSVELSTNISFCVCVCLHETTQTPFTTSQQISQPSWHLRAHNQHGRTACRINCSLSSLQYFLLYITSYSVTFVVKRRSPNFTSTSLKFPANYVHINIKYIFLYKLFYFIYSPS